MEHVFEYSIDIINYLSIMTLEKLGNLATEEEITNVEKIVLRFIESGIEHYLNQKASYG